MLFNPRVRGPGGYRMHATPHSKRGLRSVDPKGSMVRDARSWGLLFMAGVCASRAVAYFPASGERLPIGLREVAQILPVQIYGVLWASAAIGLAVVAFLQWPPKPWQALLVAPSLLWGGLYLTTWIADRSPNGLTSAFLFLCMGGLTACLILIPPRRLR